MFAGSPWVGWDSKFVFHVTAQIDCDRSRAQRASDGTCLHLLGFGGKILEFTRPSLKSPLHRDTIANKGSTQPCKVPGAEPNKTSRKTVMLIDSMQPRRHRRYLSPELCA